MRHLCRPHYLERRRELQAEAARQSREFNAGEFIDSVRQMLRLEPIPDTDCRRVHEQARALADGGAERCQNFYEGISVSYQNQMASVRRRRAHP
jgi:hypothetical protein